MPIAAECPNCQAKFRLPDELAGRRVKCQKCGQIFAVAAAGESLAGASPTRDVSTRDAATKAPGGHVAPLPRPPVAPPAVEEEIVDAKLSDDQAPAPPERGVRAAAAVPPVPDPRTERTSPRRAEREEREEPPPQRRERRTAARGSDPVVMVAIIGGVLLVIGSGVAGYLMVASQPVLAQPNPFVLQPGPFKQGQPFAMAPRFDPNIKVPPLDVTKAIKIALDKGVYEAKHSLAANDPLDPDRRQPCKLFVVALEAGRTYVIDQKAPRTHFDSYLRLENPQGQQLAANDDGGGYPNARILFTATQTGDHRIIATSLSGGVGEFTFSVRDSTVPGAAGPGPAGAAPAGAQAPPVPNVGPQPPVKPIQGKVSVKNLVGAATKPEIVTRDQLSANDEAKVFSVSPKAGDTYTFEVQAEGFTPALKINTTAGATVQEARAKEGSTSVQVMHRMEKAGQLRIHVTAADKKTGAFTLTIRH